MTAKATIPDDDTGLRGRLRRLYHFSDTFRMIRLGFDIVVVGIFLALSFIHEPWVVTIDLVLGVVLLAEFLVRVWVALDRRAFFLQWENILDIIIIASLFVPSLIGNFAFLRVLRAARLLTVVTVVRQLRRRSRFFQRNGEVISSALNLILFVFIMSALVYVMQEGSNPEINDILDAVYFTVTALTTTGFGDITLVGDSGRILSIAIMLIGISLFLRLAQAIFRPQKANVECRTCGLGRHDYDAVHCKHCGAIVNIPNDGD
jgi:voltage-gated potassium channel